jgi:hypothetical protein
MNEPKQIVYHFEGHTLSREVEYDLNGDHSIPELGTIIDRRERRWRVVRMSREQKLTLQAVPLYRIYLSLI